VKLAAWWPRTPGELDDVRPVRELKGCVGVAEGVPRRPWCADLAHEGLDEAGAEVVGVELGSDLGGEDPGGVGAVEHLVHVGVELRGKGSGKRDLAAAVLGLGWLDAAADDRPADAEVGA